MRTARNPNHQRNFTIEGYKDLGWQNGWKSIYEKNDRGTECCVGYADQPEYNACRKAGHKKREVDNSMFQMRGTDNIVICDECKQFSHYDCSD